MEASISCENRLRMEMPWPETWNVLIQKVLHTVTWDFAQSYYLISCLIYAILEELQSLMLAYRKKKKDAPKILPFRQDSDFRAFWSGRYDFYAAHALIKEVCSWTENVSSAKVVTTKICPQCQSSCLICILCIQREWKSNVRCASNWRHNHNDKNIPSLYIFVRTPL